MKSKRGIRNKSEIMRQGKSIQGTQDNRDFQNKIGTNQQRSNLCRDKLNIQYKAETTIHRGKIQKITGD